MKALCHLLAALLLMPASALAAAPAGSETVALQGSLSAGRIDTDTPPDLREAIVFFRPAAPRPVEPGADVEMRMAGKAFVPGVLAVTAGTRVHFPNTDPILHNAFSTSPQAPFDLGFYSGGETRTQSFDRPGLIRVYCNVHHSMVGYVMVLDTPYFTQPDKDGRYMLELPQGIEGTLYFWHPQAEVQRKTLAATSRSTFDVALDFTGRRLPRHLNKHGRSYAQAARQY